MKAGTYLYFSRQLLGSPVMSDYTTVVGYFDQDYKNDEKFTVSNLADYLCEIFVIYKAAVYVWLVY